MNDDSDFSNYCANTYEHELLWHQVVYVIYVLGFVTGCGRNLAPEIVLMFPSFY